jgi:ABC-type Zn uptake system ZnuABC Zn-binding protein ZnuA
VLRFFLTIFFAILGLAQLGAQTTPPIRIVASFTIPHEWCQVAVGQSLNVKCLVPEKSELHGFQLSAKDAQSLDRASLIIGMSPDLEPWLAAWVKANHREAKVIWLSPASPTTDPHRWTDPQEALKMLEALHLALGRLLPGVASPQTYERQVAEMKAVDQDLSRLFSSLPENARTVITQHPNLSWFAKRYGLRIADTILASGSAEAADPSARHYSDLLTQIRTQQVRVIITDEGQNETLARRLAKDAAIPAPLALSFEYLEPRGQDGDTWASMMRRNAQRLHAALMTP